jgi:hypothetical protein
MMRLLIIGSQYNQNVPDPLRAKSIPGLSAAAQVSALLDTLFRIRVITAPRINHLWMPQSPKDIGMILAIPRACSNNVSVKGVFHENKMHWDAAVTAGMRASPVTTKYS